MSYHITLRASKFHIPSEAIPYAHAALRNLCAPGKGTIQDSSGYHYSWVDSKRVLAARDFKGAMGEWRYSVALDAVTGDCTDINFTGEKAGDEEELFGAIAPYVTAGSYLEYHGEDGAIWRWVFDGTTATEVQAVITFP